jgi:hypothetical protein
MYCITDEQIEYILNDIRRNGVEMEDLQYNLLDHICCIIEQELKEHDDFEHFYQQTVKRFYKHNLREIEEETINLLTFKNYYAMKKTMIVSGAISVAAFIAGSFFKYMYWPGAGVLLTLGIGTFSLLFLPLLFVLKSREAKAASDKFVVAIGAAVGIMFSLAILFIVQHWPGANVLLFSAIGIAAFVLLPAYFFTGIRRPETKLNTIMMSIILVGVIGLQFTMVRLRPSGSQLKIRMNTYVQNEVLLKKLQEGIVADKTASEITAMCEQLKAIVLDRSIGTPTIPPDYETTKLHLNEGNLGQEFDENGAGVQLLTRLRSAVDAYNAANTGTVQRIPTSTAVLQSEPAKAGTLYTNLTFLNSITQVEMYVAIAEHSKAMSLK